MWTEEPAHAMLQRELLDLPEVKLGWSRRWLSKEQLDDYATTAISSGGDSPDALLVDLTLATSKTDQEIDELLDDAPVSDASHELALKRWRLCWLTSLRDSNLDPEEKLDQLQDIYAAFDFPEDMAGCSIYGSAVDSDHADAESMPGAPSPLSEMNRVIQSLSLELGLPRHRVARYRRLRVLISSAAALIVLIGLAIWPASGVDDEDLHLQTSAVRFLEHYQNRATRATLMEGPASPMPATFSPPPEQLSSSQYLQSLECKKVVLIEIGNRVCGGTLIKQEGLPAQVLTSYQCVAKALSRRHLSTSSLDVRVLLYPDEDSSEEDENDRTWLDGKISSVDPAVDLALIDLNELPAELHSLAPTIFVTNPEVGSNAIAIGFQSDGYAWIQDRGTVLMRGAFRESKSLTRLDGVPWDQLSPDRRFDLDVILTDNITGSGYLGSPALGNQGELVGIVSITSARIVSLSGAPVTYLISAGDARKFVQQAPKLTPRDLPIDLWSAELQVRLRSDPISIQELSKYDHKGLAWVFADGEAHGMLLVIRSLKSPMEDEVARRVSKILLPESVSDQDGDPIAFDFALSISKLREKVTMAYTVVIPSSDTLIETRVDWDGDGITDSEWNYSQEQQWRSVDIDQDLHQAASSILTEHQREVLNVALNSLEGSD